MDLRKVKKLIELVEESGIAELEVTSGDESVRIAMAGATAIGAHLAAQPVEAVQTQPAGAAPAANAGEQQSSRSYQLQAPMAGTFYRAPSPDADPYVVPGQTVQAGDVVCIIESMKMMHEIRTEQGGTVSDLPIANGQPIGTGDVILALS